jgi:hypothetical protein
MPNDTQLNMSDKLCIGLSYEVLGALFVKIATSLTKHYLVINLYV